jgi:hypothetical protein
MTAASEYGTFRLTYTPPEATGQEYYPLITVEMSTSGDANVDQMLRFYEAFLAASGFSLRGDLQVVEPDDSPRYDPWSITTRGSQATDFVPFSLSDDVISSGGK